MNIGERSISIKLKDWYLEDLVFPEVEGTTGRRITFVGDTLKSHFIRKQKAEVYFVEATKVKYKNKEILNHQGNEKTLYTEYGQLAKYESDPEFEIVEHIAGGTEVLEDKFNNLLGLRDILHKYPDKEVILTLGLYGLKLGFEIEMDSWPDDTLLSISRVEVHV